ncbi:MAG: FAD-binding protein [Chloroflexi bacterium]|nr:FAD-binding protein [Chloroflexota bacterium]
MEQYEIFEHDVLVIGAGGAGLRAAIAAAEAGLTVGLVCKSLLGKAHTVMAEGGIAAALGGVDPQDNWQVHFADTMRGGQFINDWRMAEIHAKEAPERVLELERWGALFDRTPEGKILQRPFGAHTYRRLSHVGDRTGLEMIRTLQDRAIQAGIDVYPEVTTTALLKDGARIAGAFGYRRETGRFILFPAKAVILATGGWGRIWQVTSNSWESTGDGAAMAYEVGADLRDVEMMQVHPTGMVWPPGVRGLLVTEAVRGEGGVLRNSQGERFMLRYDPQKKDLSSRDVVARAINQEVLEGRGSPHGGAFLDVTPLGADRIRQKLPNMYDQYLKLADIDITKVPMEVAPTVHYAMGGLRVEPESGATTVPGLYAAGEVASGLHGANRLGGNSLSDLVVFGKRAGECAATYSRDLPATLQVPRDVVEAEIVRVLAPFERDGNENPFLLHEELQATMQERASIIRTGEGLQKALEKILELKERSRRTRITGSRMYNPGWHMTIDLDCMLTLSEAVVRAAIARRESRGAHYRLDHPNKDPEFGKLNIIARKSRGEMTITTVPVPPMPEELARLFT